uniref:Uncharacterized protein n=1 Tax=Cacopsylla melanoneura TaxID=428564 RepID=A0A8D8SBS5_9HEMI
MLCFYLALFLVTSNVYTLNAHDEESGKGAEDRTAQMIKHKDCLLEGDTRADKLNTFIREYAQKQGQQTRKKKKPAQTDFKFRMKMNERLRNLEQEGDISSLNELTDRVKRAYELQQSFKRLLTEASDTDKETPLGLSHEKHMIQMNTMKVYMKKLRRKGVPEHSELNRASDKLMEYWFKHIEHIDEGTGDQRGQRRTKEVNIFRFRREINDDDDADPENPYHDPANPFHFRRKLEKKLNKLAAEEKSAEIDVWKAKIIRSNEAQREFYEYLDNRTHSNNNTIMIGYDHPGHRQHLINMATYKQALEKKHLETYIIENKIADKHFAYWLKMVDNQTLVNPNRLSTPSPTHAVNLGQTSEKPANRT